MKCLICKIKYHQHLLGEGNHGQHGAVTSPQDKNRSVRRSGGKPHLETTQAAEAAGVARHISPFSQL